jgi:inorganic pyrophosphatase/exopolyphosphatase
MVQREHTMKKESINDSQRAAMMGGKREAGAMVSTDTSVVTGTRSNGHLALYVPTTGGKVISKFTHIELEYLKTQRLGNVNSRKRNGGR